MSLKVSLVIFDLIEKQKMQVEQFEVSFLFVIYTGLIINAFEILTEILF